MVFREGKNFILSGEDSSNFLKNVFCPNQETLHRHNKFMTFLQSNVNRVESNGNISYEVSDDLFDFFDSLSEEKPITSCFVESTIAIVRTEYATTKPSSISVKQSFGNFKLAYGGYISQSNEFSLKTDKHFGLRRRTENVEIGLSNLLKPAS